MVDLIDKNGYRANVGIVLMNPQKELFIAKRRYQSGWQFPQGGIHIGETPESAMYRELLEETGLTKNDTELLSESNNWYQYKIPKKHLRKLKKGKPFVIGQRQKWFMLKLTGSEEAISLIHPSKFNQEFDNWKWVDPALPAKQVIRFKQHVYEQVLSEFQTFFNP